ncbi:MAG: hypothetical protein U0521_01900 [Anaerolineae bacterium]
MNIWMATSPDLIHWGDVRLVLEAPSGKPGWWQSVRRSERTRAGCPFITPPTRRIATLGVLTALDAPDPDHRARRAAFWAGIYETQG